MECITCETESPSLHKTQSSERGSPLAFARKKVFASVDFLALGRVWRVLVSWYRRKILIRQPTALSAMGTVTTDTASFASFVNDGQGRGWAWTASIDGIPDSGQGARVSDRDILGRFLL